MAYVVVMCPGESQPQILFNMLLKYQEERARLRILADFRLNIVATYRLQMTTTRNGSVENMTTSTSASNMSFDWGVPDIRFEANISEYRSESLFASKRIKGSDSL